MSLDFSMVSLCHRRLLHCALNLLIHVGSWGYIIVLVEVPLFAAKLHIYAQFTTYLYITTIKFQDGLPLFVYWLQIMQEDDGEQSPGQLIVQQEGSHVSALIHLMRWECHDSNTACAIWREWITFKGICTQNLHTTSAVHVMQILILEDGAELDDDEFQHWLKRTWGISSFCR